MHGKLDIAFVPSGFAAGFDALRPRATDLVVALTSLRALVASLEDVEHSKRGAGRPKDRRYLETVGRLRPPGTPPTSCRRADAPTGNRGAVACGRVGVGLEKVDKPGSMTRGRRARRGASLRPRSRTT